MSTYITPAIRISTMGNSSFFLNSVDLAEEAQCSGSSQYAQFYFEIYPTFEIVAHIMPIRYDVLGS